MEENEVKVKNRKKMVRILFILYIIVMLTIILVNGLSKYRTSLSGSATAEVAKPIVNILTGDGLTVSELHNEEYEWNFQVNNFDGNEVSQVLMGYRIKIDLGTLTNLQYKLYKVSGSTKTELTLNNNQTQEFELPHTNKTTDYFCLEIKTTDNVNQSDLQGNIDIDIVATQKR